MRQDYRAAANLLERAAALSTGDAIDIAVTVDLAEALFFAGRIDDACRSLSAAAERTAGAARKPTSSSPGSRRDNCAWTWRPKGSPTSSTHSSLRHCRHSRLAMTILVNTWRTTRGRWRLTSVVGWMPS
jgi:hypothetical protein